MVSRPQNPRRLLSLATVLAALAFLVVLPQVVFPESPDLRDFIEIPKADRDNHGNPIRKGHDPKTGLPFEVREKKTGMHLVLIPAGTFEMGLSDGFGNEKPVHTVTISKAFYAGKYEVTVGELKRFVQATRYKTEREQGKGSYVYSGKGLGFEKKADASWKNPYFKQTDDHPVVLVSWNDAREFLEWLNGGQAAPFALPTEAQWEYAARVGSKTRWHWGDDEDEIGKYANIVDKSAKARYRKLSWARDHDDGYAATAPVGKFRPNRFGLYDSTGNVWEWCRDWYDEDFYGRSPGTDPANEKEATSRVLRGGAWFDPPDIARPSIRFRIPPAYCDDFLGFRVVLAVVGRVR